MKRFLLILAAAAALVACGNAPKVSDPLQDALEAKIKALTSEDAKVTFFKFENLRIYYKAIDFADAIFLSFSNLANSPNAKSIWSNFSKAI